MPTLGDADYRYPASGVRPDVPLAVQQLAQDVARVLDSVATVADLPSSGNWNGRMKIVRSTPGAIWMHDGSSWAMHGVAVFADSTARATALPSPQTGMRTMLESTGAEYVWAADWERLSTGRVIKSGTITAVSSLAIDGLTGADRYEITLDIPTTSAANSISGQLRASGVTDTGSNYTHQRISAGGASTSAASATETSWPVQMAGLSFKFAQVNLYKLNSAAKTFAEGFSAGSARMDSITMWHATEAAYDGVLLTASTGTISGTYTVRAW